MEARKQKISWSGHQVEKGEHSRNAPGKKEKRNERSELHKDNLKHKLSRKKETPMGRAPIPAYNNFAPLLESRTTILAVEKDKVPIQWPAPIRSSAEKRDTEKYCRYHRDHGHDIEGCRQLKNQIEDLIRKENLRKYVDRNAHQQRRENIEEAPQQPDEQQHQFRGVIHTISGGVAYGGDHKNAIKAYGRQSLAMQQI
ncbi:hypothetical protein CFOL_v3_14674 [Cephalotus follicularis]|uniref:Uncharacterized protein n=1 Tax=Cephalotus follicularis TaxID=3775 RepID=A0A1Q3BTA2_CEPFO|nr:hypothetical protein CFOL_v3_14674 [Cephalotus follicularis]